MRLTPTSYAVLALLDQFGELSSYDMKLAVEEVVGFFWAIPHTTLYEEPVRLSEAGYLSVDEEGGGRRRRQYALTDAGRKALQAWIEEPVAAPPKLRDERLLKIYAGADPRLVLDQRIELYQARIIQLEASLEALSHQEDESKGPALALSVAIRYNRGMADLARRLAEDAN